MSHPDLGLSIPMYLEIFCNFTSDIGHEAVHLLSNEYLHYAKNNGMAPLTLTRHNSEEFDHTSTRSYKFFGESASELNKCYMQIDRELASGKPDASSTLISVVLFPQIVPSEDFELNPLELRADTFGYAPLRAECRERRPIGVRITYMPTGTSAACDIYENLYLNGREAKKMLVSRLIATTNSLSERFPSLRFNSYPLSENNLLRLRMKQKLKVDLLNQAS